MANMDLSKGAVSLALLQAAGQGLQAECTAIAPIAIGEVKVTGAHDLPCKKVFHVRCPPWDSGAGQTELVRQYLHLEMTLDILMLEREPYACLIH